MEESMTDIDSIKFDEAEYFNALLQDQEAHYFVDFPPYIEESQQNLRKAAVIIDKALNQMRTADLVKSLTTLNIQLMRTQEEMELIKQDIEATETVSDKDLEALTRKVEVQIQEQVKTNKVLDKLNQTNMFYELLKIKIEAEKPNRFNVKFLNKFNSSEEPIRYVKIEAVEEVDFTRYEVLEQRGTPDNDFEEINYTLMKTDNIINFLVSLRHYFDSTIIS